MSGYFKVYRNMFDASHDLHPHARGEPACAAFAWLDLIAMAEYDTNRSRARGSVDVSQRFLAVRWNWHRSRVRRFLTTLEHAKRITREPSAVHGRAQITIVKYDTYQPTGTTNRPDPRPTDRPTDRPKDKEEEEEQAIEEMSPSESNDSSGSMSASADEQAVFDHWKGESGHKQARFSKRRRAKVRQRLRSFTTEQLKQAVSNACADPFYRGENESGTRYDWLETILKNDEAVERHLERQPERRHGFYDNLPVLVGRQREKPEVRESNG